MTQLWILIGIWHLTQNKKFDQYQCDNFFDLIPRWFQAKLIPNVLCRYGTLLYDFNANNSLSLLKVFVQISEKICWSCSFVGPNSYLAEVTTPLINPSLSFVVWRLVLNFTWESFTLTLVILQTQGRCLVQAPFSLLFLQRSSLYPQNQSKSPFGSVAPCNTISKRYIH